MPDFYFTYGTNKCFPFRGGWTRVTAPSINVALSAFVAVHPNVNDCLNCFAYYTEADLLKTACQNKGICGAFEHVHISVSVNVTLSPKEKTAENGNSQTVKR